MNYKLLFFFCLIGSYTSAQTLKGTIYNATQTIADVSVKNLSKDIQIYSSSKGAFKIAAEVNDSIYFYIFPYAPQVKVVTNDLLKAPFVIELKEVNNQLDEVLLRNKVVKATPFSAPKYEENVQQSILSDIDKNPHLYEPAPSTPGLNFIALFRAAAKLVKKKGDKKTPKSTSTISATDLEKLFEDHPTFNDTFLSNELKLPANYSYAFFDYFEDQYIDYQLLESKNTFLLIDKLIKLSEEYLIMLNNIRD
ncbi:hypothetical protein DCS32_06255 [Dokdonia sp. Dokd-P16]|uniref:hypothetical protein n=1 Tax=Dokdonia sp. Dokd-P16 TaxID=2173169 RepID=UPI000D546076|nr:hypothetical protein [Dokdonia sp. Dokd-P16]AWH73770.1 hypothetical protein DCS32_06255 [Dokdonia sp. Dokd-P16]